MTNALGFHLQDGHLVDKKDLHTFASTLDKHYRLALSLKINHFRSKAHDEIQAKINIRFGCNKTTFRYNKQVNI